jgi:hypothetical protein
MTKVWSAVGPPLWSSGQNFWLQIQRPGCDSQRYQIFWGVVGLERGPLVLVRTSEKLLETKGSGSGLENREYSRRDPSPWLRGTLYPQTLALSSPISGGRSVGIVLSKTQRSLLCLFVVSGWILPFHLTDLDSVCVEMSIEWTVPRLLFVGGW